MINNTLGSSGLVQPGGGFRVPTAPTPKPNFDINSRLGVNAPLKVAPVAPATPLAPKAPVTQPSTQKNPVSIPSGQGTGDGTAAPVKGIFPSVVGSLQSMAQTPAPQYNAAQNNSAQAQNALFNAVPQQNANVQGATQNIQALQDEYAKQNGIIGNSPIGLSEQGGEQGLLNQQYATKLGAAQTALQNALTGNAQEQAAFTGAGNLANSSAGIATGQQATQQSGLAAAGGLSQPQQVGPTNVPFNPAEGTYGAPAANAFGQGGLQGVGALQGQIGVGQNVTQLNSYLGGANVVGQNLQQLIADNNINPTDLTYANQALQFGADKMSNPAYQKFAGQINDFVASLAPILGVGGSATDMKTQMSSQIVNALHSGSTISQVVQYFLDQAKQKVQGLSAGGGAGVGSSPAGGGTTFGSFF